MIAAARWLVALALLVVPQTAVAHPVFGGVGGLTGGLLHPLFVLQHSILIVALGLLIGRQPRSWTIALAFGFGLAAGSFAIAAAYASNFSTEAVLALTVAIGALVALARPLPGIFSGSLAAAAGFAIAFDSAPDAISINQAIFTQLGTFLAASVYLAAVTAISLRLTSDWQRTGIRILGSWIAASAALAVTLQLFR